MRMYFGMLYSSIHLARTRCRFLSMPSEIKAYNVCFYTWKGVAPVSLHQFSHASFRNDSHTSGYNSLTAMPMVHVMHTCIIMEGMHSVAAVFICASTASSTPVTNDISRRRTGFSEPPDRNLTACLKQERPLGRPAASNPPSMIGTSQCSFYYLCQE